MSEKLPARRALCSGSSRRATCAVDSSGSRSRVHGAGGGEAASASAVGSAGPRLFSHIDGSVDDPIGALVDGDQGSGFIIGSLAEKTD